MHTADIKITVATVTWNAATLVQRTLDSVDLQEHPNVEHLIIDGKSSDGTVAMAEAYKNNTTSLHSIKIISEPDRGLYDAMNKAINLATGHYIVFLNAGDVFHSPQVLITIAQCASANYNEAIGLLPGVIYGNTNIVDAEGHFLHKRRLQPPLSLNWKSFRRGMLVCHQAFFANMAIARNHPYNLKYRFSADFDWCIRIMKDAKNNNQLITNSTTIIADYLNEGMTTKNHRKSLFERFRIMTKHYGLITTVCQHLYFVLRAIGKSKLLKLQILC